MKTEYQIIAVDFDGTLCTDCFPKIAERIEKAGTPDYFVDVPLWKSVRGSSGMVQEVGTGI